MKLRQVFPQLINGLLLAFVALVLAAAPTFAFDWQAGEVYELGQNEESSGSLYVFGQSITIDGKVNGDLICAGERVVVTGPVIGDIICASADLHLEGPVSGDIRVAGQNLSLSGEIYGSAHVLSQNFDFSGFIARELAFAGQKAILNGQTDGDIVGFTQMVELNGHFGGDVNLTSETITIGQAAFIRDNFVYSSPKPADFTPAQVGGQVSYQPLETDEKPARPQFQSWFSGRLAAIASFLLMGLLMVYAWPKLITRMIDEGTQAPLKAFLVGLLSLILWPILSLVLLVTVIGIPLSVMLILWGILVLIVARLVPAIWLGQILAGTFQAKPTLIMAALVGIPVSWFVFGLPGWGMGLNVLASIWGTGAIILALKQSHVKKGKKHAGK
jgi:cytoskeletal protein CcmA (bactofilin family)